MITERFYSSSSSSSSSSSLFPPFHWPPHELLLDPFTEELSPFVLAFSRIESLSRLLFWSKPLSLSPPSEKEGEGVREEGLGCVEATRLRLKFFVDEKRPGCLVSSDFEGLFWSSHVLPDTGLSLCGKERENIHTTPKKISPPSLLPEHALHSLITMLPNVLILRNDAFEWFFLVPSLSSIHRSSFSPSEGGEGERGRGKFPSVTKVTFCPPPELAKADITRTFLYRVFIFIFAFIYLDLFFFLSFIFSSMFHPFSSLLSNSLL